MTLLAESDMRNEELEKWWASLSISQKERIARKGLSKASPDGSVDESFVQYPGCSRWWSGLDEKTRILIYGHCVDTHGYLLKEWNDADPYGGD
ncbi:MAG: hypothetical protein IJL91_00745 [Bacteroidales bacterium]|nr:hypothetical protein [Bacteroidales bacterium]